MVKNKIEVDVKVKCIENETTQAELAEKIGTTASYVNRVIKEAGWSGKQHLCKDDGGSRV